MKKWMINVAFAAALISVGYWCGHHSLRPVHAQEQVPVAKFYREGTLPRSWGHAVGAGLGYVVLEDSAGVLRFISITDPSLDGNATVWELKAMADRK